MGNGQRAMGDGQWALIALGSLRAYGSDLELFEGPFLHMTVPLGHFGVHFSATFQHLTFTRAHFGITLELL